MNYVWERLSDGVHRCRLPFLDVTVGVVQGSRGLLLIDCGTTLDEARAIDADVRALTGHDGSHTVSHVVLTHCHFDHILGSSVFAGAAVYAAPEVARSLSEGTKRQRVDAVRHGARVDDVDRAIAALRQPDYQVRRVILDLGDRTVAVDHLGRGHTDHDLIAVVPPSAPHGRTVVFCGDLVEESGDPVVDLDSDLAQWPATLDRLLHAGGPDAVYVPGHGAIVDYAFIRRQQVWLRNS